MSVAAPTACAGAEAGLRLRRLGGQATVVVSGVELAGRRLGGLDPARNAATSVDVAEVARATGAAATESVGDPPEAGGDVVAAAADLSLGRWRRGRAVDAAASPLPRGAVVEEPAAARSRRASGAPRSGARRSHRTARTTVAVTRGDRRAAAAPPPTRPRPGAAVGAPSAAAASSAVCTSGGGSPRRAVRRRASRRAPRRGRRRGSAGRSRRGGGAARRHSSPLRRPERPPGSRAPRASAARPPGDPRPHRSGRDVEHRGDLRVVEVGEVAQHDGDAEVLGELGERGVHVEPRFDSRRLDRRVAAGLGQRSSAGAGRRLRRRSSSSAALVATRYTQVVKAERPSKRPMPREIAISASWVASSASSGSTERSAGTRRAHGRACRSSRLSSARRSPAPPRRRTRASSVSLGTGRAGAARAVSQRGPRRPEPVPDAGAG